MKKTLLFTILFCTSIAVFAQQPAKKDTTYWKKTIQTGANLNQASFTNNWRGGGVNAIALGLFYNGKFEYNKEKHSFTSDMQLQYGVTKSDGQGQRKSQDKIYFDNKYAYQIHKHWSVFGSLNLLTQFDNGYAYGTDGQGNETKSLISGFFAPAYVTESGGLEYKPVTYFGIRFGLATLKQTIVKDKSIALTDPKNYGVPIGKTIRNQAGMEIVASFDKNIMENVNLKARYNLFGDYSRLAHLTNRLDVTLTAKVNKFMNVNISGIALYDDDIDYKIQASQSLALGVVFTL